MSPLLDENTVNVVVDGVFDDYQDLVKTVDMDADFKVTWHMDAVNSINWARLPTQVCYYVATWPRVTEEGVNASSKTSVVAPSDNSGNVCVAHTTHQIGVSLGTLVIATNRNDVLDEFFRADVYRLRSSADTLVTFSSFMGISKASNFERSIFDLLGRDGDATRILFDDVLTRDGYFDLSGTPGLSSLRNTYGFTSGTSSHADRLAETARTEKKNGYLLDPHMTDGVHVARTLRSQIEGPLIVAETTLLVKFAETIQEATDRLPPVPERFEGTEGREECITPLVNSAEDLKALIVARVRSGA